MSAQGWKDAAGNPVPVIEFRDRYARECETRPRKFDGTTAHHEWAARALAHAIAAGWIVESPTAETLRLAARVSVTLPLDPETGYRVGDPLMEIIRGGLEPVSADLRAVVLAVAGKDDDAGQNMNAARARSILRRWAIRSHGDSLATMETADGPEEFTTDQLHELQMATIRRDVAAWDALTEDDEMGTYDNEHDAARLLRDHLAEILENGGVL